MDNKNTKDTKDTKDTNDTNDTKEKKIPRKRGRKPKIFNAVKLNTNNEIKKNYIIKLKNNDINLDIENIDSYNEQVDVKFEMNYSEICWNCCHSFHNIIYGLPLKYINNIFYIYGDFCSLECAIKYGYDNLKYKNIWELFSIINLYNKKINDDTIKPIKMAQSKLLLKKFGGDLTIEEYRKNFQKNNLHTIQLPPIIPINHITETYEMNNNLLGNNNYKLYRKNKLNSDKKNIKNTMELEIK